MDLVLEEKASLNDTPLQLTCQPNNNSSSMAAIIGSAVSQSSSIGGIMASTVTTPTSQPSFTSGVPTLLPPSQMSYASLGVVSSQHLANATSKYAQLLQVIEELGKDIRPTYSGSKSSGERLKRGIIHARILVRECLMETERNNARN